MKEITKFYKRFVFNFKNKINLDIENVNNKSLNIFYKEHPLFFKMLDLWTLININECMYYLFKTELNCKSKKEYEYIFLNQLFLYIYFKIRLKPN